MNQRQKLIQTQFLNNEEAILKRLQQVYGQSQKDINSKIANLQFSIGKLQAEYDWLDDNDPEKAKVKSMIQSKIYQKQYQEALKGQVDTILDDLQTKAYTNISDYLKECYDDGFVGTMFDLQGQGIPLCMPLDQEAVVRAVQLDSKISNGLYSRMGEDVSMLKKHITAQVSRGISSGMSFEQVAQQIQFKMTGTYDSPGGALARAMTIARTEGHRIQVQAGMDACYRAKEKGADVVKQWDSTMDSATRESHVAVDGEIRELDKPFSNGLMFPGDPSGGAAEVVNCRCALLQRAKWALDKDELEVLKERASFFGLDKAETFEDYKKKYLKVAESIKTDTEAQQRIRARREAWKQRQAEKKAKTPDFGSMDRKQLEQYASENLKTIFEDTKGANTEFIRETVKVMDEFEKKMGGTIEGLHIKFGGVNQGAYAHFDFKQNTLHLKKTGSIETFVKRQQEENERALRKIGKVRHSTTTYSGTVWHELGHAVDYDMGQGLSRKLSTDAELFKSSVKISQYAGSSPAIGAPKRSEAWAENFAAYMDGGTTAKEVPTEIVQMIEDYFKKKH